MYTAQFFDVIREGCQRSAAAVVPLVVDVLHPRTVVDVGCGEGWWGRAFEGHGADVVGVDGADTPAVLDRFHTADLAESVPDVGTFDLAVCLEVAEHLPASRASSFVAELCALAPFVLFSAAVPGQGGVGHVNEQWSSYWADLFAGSGYTVSTTLRADIWQNPDVEHWYRQNVLVAARVGAKLPAAWFGAKAQQPPLDIVHPDFWRDRLSWLRATMKAAA